MNKDFDPRAVAVLGFHDGSAGQIETWFEKVTGDYIACFVHEAAQWPSINVEEEQKKRVSQRTEFPCGGCFKGRPLIAALDWPAELLRRGIRKVLPLTPDNRTRLRQIVTCRSSGLELVSAIHPTALILADASVAAGVWINARCVIGYKAEICAGAIINTAAVIEHHNVLEECCQVDPGVTTAGSATLRTCAHVHTGAVVANRVEIGADAVIGAASLVLRDVPPRAVAWGVPARVIRTLGPDGNG